MLVRLKRQWRVITIAAILIAAAVTAVIVRNLPDDIVPQRYDSALADDVKTNGSSVQNDAFPFPLVKVDPTDPHWGDGVDAAPMLRAYFRADASVKIVKRQWIAMSPANNHAAALLLVATYAHSSDPDRRDTSIVAVATQPNGTLFIASAAGLFSERHIAASGDDGRGTAVARITSYREVPDGADLVYNGTSAGTRGIAILHRSLRWTGSQLVGDPVDATPRCTAADLPAGDVDAVDTQFGRVQLLFNGSSAVCSVPSGPVRMDVRDASGALIAHAASDEASRPIGAWDPSGKNHVALGSSTDCIHDTNVYSYTFTLPWGQTITAQLRCRFDSVSEVWPGS